MPRTRPVLDYSCIRDYAERFTWQDPVTGSTQTGYNPPANALSPRRLPFSVTFLTEDGIPYTGRAVCIGVNTARRTRRLQFVEDASVCLHSASAEQRRLFKVITAGEIRQVADILIVEIDGIRFSAS